MKNYLLVIKDKEHVYKIGTGPYYLHEDAALNIYNDLFGTEDISDFPTIELAKKGCITIKSSINFIVMSLPNKFNTDQKNYIDKIKDFLKDNVSILYIDSVRIEDDNYIIDECTPDYLKDNLDSLLDKKSDDCKVLIK